MSVAQLQHELSKLTSVEKLALADYLVRQAEASVEPSAAQIAKLDRRYADALAHPETLLSPEDAHLRLVR